MDGPCRPVSVTRRVALAHLGAGGIGLALAARGPSAAAQEATPDALPPTVAEWVDAWEAVDLDRIVALYAEDARYEDIPFAATVDGREPIREYLAAVFGAFSDIDVAVTSAFGAGNHAAAEWTFAGNYVGQFPNLPPGAGQPVVIRFATLLELAGGTIQRQADYGDLYGVLVQIGAVPGAGTPETAASPAAGVVRLEAYDIGWRTGDQEGPQVTLTVRPGATIELVNTGAAAHNFDLAALGVFVVLPPGGSADALIPADAPPGEYEFICSVPGHAPAGMVGTLIIR